MPVKSINGRPFAPPIKVTRPINVVAKRPVAAPLRSTVQLPVDTSDLYPYQAEGSHWLRSRRRALFGDEMGLGKTVQVLRALPDRTPALVVCPASLRLVWRDEARRWRQDLEPVLLPPGQFRGPNAGELLIASYDSLPEPMKNARNWLVPDHRLGGATLVLDEAHYVKNYRASRSRKVALLSKQCGRTWALTGTPLVGRPTDLWGVLSAIGLAFEAFGDDGRGAWATFARLFGAKKNRWGGTDFDEEPDDGEEIQRRLARVMLRRLRAAVLPDLPSKIYSTIAVECSDELVEELDRIGYQWTDEDELPPFELVSSVRRRIAEDRCGAVLDYVQRAEEEGRPLVVFSAHRGPVEALAGREGWGVITGDTSPETRRFLVDGFQTGLLHGIALTIGAGGVGLTLTRGSIVLFADLSYTPAENAQAEDRLVRIGQKAESVSVVRMVADHPVDKRVLEILDAKQRLISAAIGG